MLQLIAAKAALSRLPWKLIIGGLLVAAILVQTLRLSYAERRAERLQFTVNELRAVIAEADKKSRQSQKEVARRIEVIKQDSPAARRVESAPLPGNCATPREILEAPL